MTAAPSMTAALQILWERASSRRGLDVLSIAIDWKDVFVSMPPQTRLTPTGH
jgi:hypothetical protein